MKRTCGRRRSSRRDRNPRASRCSSSRRKAGRREAGGSSSRDYLHRGDVQEPCRVYRFPQETASAGGRPRPFDRTASRCYLPRSLRNPRGAVAQLGERLNGIQEVDGSIPFSSTTLDLLLDATYSETACGEDADKTPEIEGRRTCFAPRERRGDRAEDAPLAQPVAATRKTDGGEHDGGDSAAGGSGERGWWRRPRGSARARGPFPGPSPCTRAARSRLPINAFIGPGTFMPRLGFAYAAARSEERRVG